MSALAAHQAALHAAGAVLLRIDGATWRSVAMFDDASLFVEVLPWWRVRREARLLSVPARGPGAEAWETMRVDRATAKTVDPAQTRSP